MVLRRGIAALVAVGLLSVGSAAARTGDASTPLTPAQLDALRNVASWDISFQESYTGQGDGSSTYGPYLFNGVLVTTATTSSYAFSLSSEAHFTVTTNGSDCDLLGHVGCPVDLTRPTSVAFSEQRSNLSTTAYDNGCAQDDFTIGPARITYSQVTDASGSFDEQSIDPANLSGAFFVDYRANPPHVFGGISYTSLVRGAGRTQFGDCNRPPSMQPEPSIMDVNVQPAMLNEDRVDAMPIAFVDGAFESSGSYTTSKSGCAETGRCGTDYTNSTESRTFTWTVREHLENEPRIQTAEFQQPDIPSGSMRAVPPTGTFDGNPVQLAVKIQNPGATAQDVQIAVIDADTGQSADVTGNPMTTIAAGQVGEVTLGWDTTGRAWKADQTPQPPHRFTLKLTNADGSRVWDTIDRRLTVLPRPIVLVHGWNSSAATWAGLQSYMASHYPYWRTFAVDTMNTGSLLSPLTPSNTVAQNAQALDAYVRSVRSQTEAQHVDLLVHSMGGLISRQYIQDEMPTDASDSRPVVSHLVMLGTPNLGSPCAYLIPWPQPSSFELRPDSVLAFNIHVTDRRGVPFSILAGTPVPTTCDLAGPGDSVVDLSSALQGGAIGDFAVDLTLLHTSMPSSISAFESFAKPRLVAGASSTTLSLLGRASSTTAASTTAVPQPQLLATDGIPLAAGETRSIDVVVGDAGAIGGILLASGDVSAELRRPDGTTAGTIDAGPLDPAQPFRSFTNISAPPSGHWTLLLANTGTTALSAAYSIWETGESGTLHVDVVDAHDGHASLTAAAERAGGNVAGEQMQATFRAVDGTTTNAALFDDGTHGDPTAGDGTFAAIQALPVSDYLVTVRASGPVPRTTFVRLEMGASQVHDTTPPSLSISHTANGAGWNKTASVAVSVSAADTGSGLAGTPTCIDSLTGLGIGLTGSAPTFTGSVAGEGAHTITCKVSDLAGNSATPATDTVRIDTTAPVVSYTDHPATYTTDQTIGIVCSAADPAPGSGVVSNSCTTIPARLAAGAYAYSADATDKAGNSGHGSTSFTVVAAPATITLAGLCLKTKELVQGSTRYRALTAAQKRIVDALATALCAKLEAITPKLTAAQKKALLSAYKTGVQMLVPLGWLTQPQATILIDLANKL